MTEPSNPSRRSSGWVSKDDRPPPEPAFLRKIGEDLWEGSLALMAWTLALWVLSFMASFVTMLSEPLVGMLSGLLGWIVAALTLAPALAGMMAMAGNMARGGFARLGYAVRGTFRLYGRSVALALPLAIFLALVLVTANMVSVFPERRELFFAWAFQIGTTLAVVILHLYLFPILALYDPSLKQTVKLAIVLAGKYIWQTLALLTLGAVLAAVTTLLPPVWLLVPAVWCVIATNSTWRLARRLLPASDGIDK